MRISAQVLNLIRSKSATKRVLIFAAYATTCLLLIQELGLVPVPRRHGTSKETIKSESDEQPSGRVARKNTHVGHVSHVTVENSLNNGEPGSNGILRKSKLLQPDVHTKLHLLSAANNDTGSHGDVPLCPADPPNLGKIYIYIKTISVFLKQNLSWY